MTNNDGRQNITINAQYVKDLSFESPNAPGSLKLGNADTDVDLAMDLHVTPIEAGRSSVYEVALHLDITATANENTLFVLELVYAGIFTLTNFDQEEKEVILSIHSPSMLFPFVRRIVANLTQDSGFQALMIDPVDFGAMYHKKMNDRLNAQQKEYQDD